MLCVTRRNSNTSMVRIEVGGREIVRGLVPAFTGPSGL